MIHFLFLVSLAEIIIHDGTVFIVNNCRMNDVNDFRFSERKYLLFLLIVRHKAG